jgi:site-specific DNA recombinase
MARNQRRQAPTKVDPNDLAGARVGLYVRVSKDDRNTQKSVDSQEAHGRQWVDRVGALHVETYRDNDRSASKKKKKRRENFDRLLADIEAEKLDVIWVWEQSRLTRITLELLTVLDLLRDNGVLLAIHERVHDPDDDGDTLSLVVQGAVSEQEAGNTSKRVERGTGDNRSTGRPQGKKPYGYRRTRDPVTGGLVQVADETPISETVPDSPADVVRKIFDRVAGGQSLNRIAQQLNNRGIPTPQEAPAGWVGVGVRYIATNATYIGKVVHDRQILEGVEGQWPSLVDDEKFYPVQRILDDPGRRHKRPARARSLLSRLALCDNCNGQLQRAFRGGRLVYFCLKQHCVSIGEADLDHCVEDVVIDWLSREDVRTHLFRVNDSEVGKQAQADVERFRLQLDGVYQEAKDIDVPLKVLTLREEQLKAEIAEAEKRVITATVPSQLVDVVGDQAKVKWDVLANEVRREIIQLIVDISVKPTGLNRKPGQTPNGCGTNAGHQRHRRRGERPCEPCRAANAAWQREAKARRLAGVPAGRSIPVEDRVEFHWRLGPDAVGEPPELS